MDTTNEKYLELIENVATNGILVKCRGYETVEILNQRTVIDMNYPLVALKNRKMGYRFACAEAYAILTGDNKVSTLGSYSKQIKNFSDDGVFFFGAYGPKIIDQLEYIGRCFKNDLYTRQAVLNIWREKPPVSKDIPCTLNMQFIIRQNENDENILNTIVNMRSSDIWLGVPYDWFTFSMVSAYVVLYLQQLTGYKIQLGELFLSAGSRHYYKDAFGYNEQLVLNTINDDHLVDFEYKPINLSEFKTPNDLISQLYFLTTNKIGFGQISFLQELEEYWRNK